jgi:hypothetical protein
MLFAFLCGLWDVIANATNQPQHTISSVILDWARSFPILPLLLGILLGHFFFPQCVPAESK